MSDICTMDTPSRKRPAASTSSGSSSRSEPFVPSRYWWNRPKETMYPLLKTIRIVAPLSGETLTVFNHYGRLPRFGPEVAEHPRNIELAVAVAEEHPPPDHEHDWILIDPVTTEELPADRTPFTNDHIYAVLRKRDRDEERRKWQRLVERVRQSEPASSS